MAYKYLEILTTNGVEEAQRQNGSRDQWLNFKADRVYDYLDDEAIDFIARRDSFYIATNSESGWPYLQHRGGPVGFLKVINDKCLGFADFKGNRQYITQGNTITDDRVALFLMDYPNRRRMKMMARLKTLSLDDDPELTEKILDVDYSGKAERIMILSMEVYDWNCPQHIVPRFSEDMIRVLTESLQKRVSELESENKRLRADLNRKEK